VELAAETFEALLSERGDTGKIWASVLKEAIKRRKPDFSEGRYGFRTFGNLLEEAQARGLLEFGRDEKSGAYVYRSHGGPTAAAASARVIHPVQRPLPEAWASRGERPTDLRALLQQAFGFGAFRPHQEAECRAAIDGRDLLLVMPTGAGKSLCYQLPGPPRGGTTLVVSPPWRATATSAPGASAYSSNGPEIHGTGVPDGTGAGSTGRPRAEALTGRPDSDRITARSTVFWSSRTLPGQR